MSTRYSGFAGLHVGLPKTATTLLQDRLFPNHPEIAYLGKHLTRSASENMPTEQCIETAIRKPFDRCNLDDLAHDFERMVAQYREVGQRLVWSSEDLTVGSRARRQARAERLHAILGPCRVILTIRHPVRLMESLYLQLIRANLVGLSARIGREWRVPKPEEWLQEHANRPESGALGHLDYAETLRIYASIFGTENVRVFVFEELVQSPNDFISTLCDYLEVNATAGTRLISDHRSNDRWTQTQFDHIQVLHQSRLSRHLMRMAPVRIRQRYIDSVRHLGSLEGARADLPVEWRNRIMKQTAPGHRWMAKQWSLPLADLGYPI